MSLRRATLLATIGICYTFVLRTVGTFLPGIFRTTTTVQAVQVISLLASLTFVFFYMLFYRDYVQREQTALRRASVLAIVGSCAILLLRIKSLILVFEGLSVKMYDMSPFLFELVSSRSAEATIPWVCSVLILCFFVMFCREALHKRLVKLQKAIFSAIISSSIGTLLLTITLFNFLHSGQSTWFHASFRILVFVFFPLSVFGFVTILYFFLTFYVHGVKSLHLTTEL